MRCIILLLLSLSGSAAAAAGVAAALGEGAAESAAAGVAAAWRWGVRAAADLAADGVAAPSAVVIVVGEEGNVAAVAVGSLLGLAGLVLAQAVVDYVIVLVDAALHLGAATAGEEGEGGCG